MSDSNPTFWSAYMSRDDLYQFGSSSLLLFTLQLKFGIEDISLLASSSLTEGFDDKKADMVYIDTEIGRAVIAQSYISEDMTKSEAPANKASDLNTAVSWILSRPLDELPVTIKSHAKELRQSIRDKEISEIYLWYVHNLPESENVRDELRTVEHTAKSLLTTNFSDVEDINNIKVQALEVGINTIDRWYKSISTPILIADKYSIPILGGYHEAEEDWNAYVTSVPAWWLYDLYSTHGTSLFSANIRDYLGSRKADKNINNGIKTTVDKDPEHFWVYNNGITALVHSFRVNEHDESGEKELEIEGISIVNGAQTTGAIGSLPDLPKENAKVQVRFITCSNSTTLQNIVIYNNSQNKITSADLRSNDIHQRRLMEEFESIPGVDYLPRRGGQEDIIKRSSNSLPSVTAGQALAAVHGDPDNAYHKKTKIWESNELYSKYFNDSTSAKHILFCYSLLKAVEKKKLNLIEKSKNNKLSEIENDQLEFFRLRGSTFMMTAAISKSLEVILDKIIPNLFNLEFRDNLSPGQAKNLWSRIVEITSSFTAPLKEGLSDGFRNKKAVDDAINTFRSLVNSTKEANKEIFEEFSSKIR